MPFKNITVYHITAKHLFTLLCNREASVVQTIWQIWCWKTEKNNNNGGCYEVSCLGAGSVFEDLWGNINRKRYLVIWRFYHFFRFSLVYATLFFIIFLFINYFFDHVNISISIYRMAHFWLGLLLLICYLRMYVNSFVLDMDVSSCSCTW